MMDRKEYGDVMKVGLITYHSAYNFGSVLQAYATQETIKKLGHDVKIINYRMPSQKNFYSLFPKKLGIKRILINILMIPTVRKRVLRQKKYEILFEKIFNLSEEINEPEELEKFSDVFEIYVSGSDQVWNNKSNEYIGVDWKRYMGPYLLNFTAHKKVSFASSPESMTKAEIEEIKDELLKFNKISCREQHSSELLYDILNMRIETVLDPTLLLREKEWLNLASGWDNKYTKQKYIFYYVFKGVRGLNKDLKKICNLTKKRKMQVVTSVPLSYVIPRRNLINAIDADSNDFINLIYNAEYVITNSYHGTLFSVNFNKNFYSLQSEKIEYSRVEQMAKRLGFSERVIYNLDNVDLDSNVDFKEINRNIDVYSKQSINYLNEALKNEY